MHELYDNALCHAEEIILGCLFARNRDSFAVWHVWSASESALIVGKLVQFTYPARIAWPFDQGSDRGQKLLPWSN